MNKRQKKKFVKKYEHKTWGNKKKVDIFFDRFSDGIFKYTFPSADLLPDSAGTLTELLRDLPDPVKHYKYQTPPIRDTSFDQMTLYAAQRLHGEDHPKIVSLKWFRELDYSGDVNLDSNNNDK
mgnify:CR=1 FL=1